MSRTAAQETDNFSSRSLKIGEMPRRERLDRRGGAEPNYVDRTENARTVAQRYRHCQQTISAGRSAVVTPGMRPVACPVTARANLGQDDVEPCRLACQPVLRLGRTGQK